MNFKLALTALSLSFGNSLFASAQACNPKPIPVRDIKFSDIGAGDIYNFELHGNARIVEPAPGDVPRALRIDQLFSFALLKDLDISPSKMQDVTMAIGVYIESIRPAISNSPDPNQNESYGWVMSHDNGGYDRAIFLHDERFGGLGMSAGYIPDSKPLSAPLQEWVQVVAVWRQGGECSLFLQNEKVHFTEAVIGKNNDGLPSVAIGAPQIRRFGQSNDNDFWIKDVKIFDYALSDQEVEALNCNFVETLKPTIDCGKGGDPVFSCTECVSGDGSASGCSGDCIWRPEVPNCAEKGDATDSVGPSVSCGDHDALVCSQCSVSADGSSGCSGDCKFADGQCRPNDWTSSTDTCTKSKYDLMVNACGSGWAAKSACGVSKSLRSATEKRAVRCCSDTAKPRWTCDVWAETSGLEGGCQSGTWCEADEICKAHDARLCTADELLNDCAQHSGCMYDKEMAWSSDTDTSCPKCKDDLMVDACGSGWAIKSACNGVSKSLSSATAKRVVRCCSDTEKKGWEKNESCGVWAESSGLKGGCQADKTWCEADEICKAHGARLCTADELVNDCAVHTGCMYDKKMAWSSDTQASSSTQASVNDEL